MSEHRNLLRGFLRGLNISVTGNSQAFGYSITITAVYGVVSASHGSPTSLEILGFAVFGVAGFSALNLIVAAFMKNVPKGEKTVVLLRATATDFLAVGAAVGSAVLLSSALTGWIVWPLVPLVAGIVYVLVQALEISVGRAEDREDNRSDNAS